MDRTSYNQCISNGFKTYKKELEKYPQPFKFCSIAKVCSGKVKDLQESIGVCSQPKEPKPPKIKRGNGQSCEKEVLRLTHCIIGKIDMELAKKSLEKAIVNAMMECRCKS